GQLARWKLDVHHGSDHLDDFALAAAAHRRHIAWDSLESSSAEKEAPGRGCVPREGRAAASTTQPKAGLGASHTRVKPGFWAPLLLERRLALRSAARSC